MKRLLRFLIAVVCIMGVVFMVFLIFQNALSISKNKVAIPFTDENKAFLEQAFREVKGQCVYKSDREQFGKSDYHQDCRITGFGDCDGYVQAWYIIVTEEFPEHRDAIRRIIVVNKRTGIFNVVGSHTVLLVKTTEGIVALDNIKKQLVYVRGDTYDVSCILCGEYVPLILYGHLLTFRPLWAEVRYGK